MPIFLEKIKQGEVFFIRKNNQVLWNTLTTSEAVAEIYLTREKKIAKGETEQEFVLEAIHI